MTEVPEACMAPTNLHERFSATTAPERLPKKKENVLAEITKITEGSETKKSLMIFGFTYTFSL
jgi:hypothetical protein